MSESNLPGLSFSRFYERFGGSCRTKHLLVVPSTAADRIRLAARFCLGRLETTNKRAYSPPAESRLPEDFIRLDPWEAEYLYSCAQRSRLGIVEVGRFHGGSTYLLACANREVPIWSIDLAPQDDTRLRRYLADNSVGQNVELLVGDSHRDTFEQIAGYDLLFIDGDHSYTGCRADLGAFFPRLQPGGQLVLHDCYAETGVQRAVLDFIAETDVAVVQSPHIPSSHWHTPYGSIAHLTKPAAAMLGRARLHLVAAALAAMLLLALLLAVLPEELGDRPYNVF
jgi:predicted O-methyltransferase YrrM